MTRMKRGIMAAIVMLAPATLAAQSVDGLDLPKAGTGTPNGWTGTLECVRCIVHVESTGTWVEFGAEPVIRGPRTGTGPHDGDVLVAVGGQLITTPAGARRLAHPGTPAPILTVRRAGRQIDYVYSQSAALTYVTADSISLQVQSSPVEMNLNTTRGWLGLALDCLRCAVDRVDRTARDSSLRFTTPPRVVAIEPGAAQQAGFRVGDIIRTIDGLSMISAEGARRFSMMRAGERVNFVVERGKGLADLRLLVPKPL